MSPFFLTTDTHLSFKPHREMDVCALLPKQIVS